ncbi:MULTISPECIES: DegT/DnrJ/EryC1/StrS aminotransferase family protein [unclassified Vibrio]|uniref:Aminotransferase class I/II-fold pyridoxal phosphate-dependent enzyme n=1 Tax=Vibrio sp. HB236076 TaxID=3232307 RepID=A0AB39HCJ5_9VIBR|nr:aminotransferase class I/II-fold pyridoxal phosphate-dependent enzyme [Vibrio sp. HB161653]MDP5254700.1 aminotransferase class I/II-fold pyridoxal phosphate-dependent enzyme [Vibrio sp. HB161653]
MKTFSKSFTQQEPISDQGIQMAVDILQTGKLHRYNLDPGEQGHTSLLEEEFAAYIGKKYGLACASCGSALYLAMKSAGVKPGDKVLCNAYTLAPVPGAIENTGASIELVEITDDYKIDLDHLAHKAATSGSRFLLLSHMRGHIADMDKIIEICKTHQLTLIEDCAHTMGAAWNGKKSGSFGHVACFSTQTYKHINSGEGGLLVTDDAELIARAIIHSGSYMLYERHTARPDLATFEALKTQVPNYSCRLDHLRAAILRPQLANLDHQCQRWNQRYRVLEQAINATTLLTCPPREPKEEFVGSSIQFTVQTEDLHLIQRFLQACHERGVEIKWFGHQEPVGFTSAFDSWHYMEATPELPNTKKVLATLCDMRIPLTFSLEDCQTIGEILKAIASELIALSPASENSANKVGSVAD